MATAIDALIVALRLDPQRQFKKDYDAAVDTSKRGNEQLVQNAKQSAASQEKFTESVKATLEAAAGLGALLLAGRGMAQFVAGQIEGAAATGRLAHNLDMSIETVSTWQGVMRRMGGGAQDANASLQAVNSTLEQLNLTGSSSNFNAMRAFHLTRQDLKDPNNAMLKIADQATSPEYANDPGRFRAVAQMFGLTDPMINTLEKGRAVVQAMLDAQRKAGIYTKEDFDQAVRVQDLLGQQQSSYERLGRTIQERVLPYVIKFEDLMNKDAQGPELRQLAKDAGALADAFGRIGQALHIRIDFDPFTALIKWADSLLNYIHRIGTSMDLIGQGKWKEAAATAWDALKNAPLVQLLQGKFGNSPAASAPTAGRAGPIARTRTAGADSRNNPGNLEDRNGRIRSFATPAEGLDAMRRQLLIDFYKHGQHTIADLIGGAHGWSRADAPGNSPASTANYEALIAKRLGIGTSDYLNVPGVLPNLMAAIKEFEHGGGGRSGHRTTKVNIQSIAVHTQAKDAAGIAKDLHGAITRYANVAAVQAGAE